jgi:hypothetical protein
MQDRARAKSLSNARNESSRPINNLDQKLKAIALLIGLPHLAVFG